jgi:hypothetical protein
MSRKFRHVPTVATFWFLLWLPLDRLASWEGLPGLGTTVSPPSLEESTGEKARCIVVIGGHTHEYEC